MFRLGRVSTAREGKPDGSSTVRGGVRGDRGSGAGSRAGGRPVHGRPGGARTAWGQPDLQGIWDFRTITPMQRPEDRGDQEFLTEEEAASLEQDAVDRAAAGVVSGRAAAHGRAAR